MALNKKFVSQPTALASFDFEDIVSGQAFEAFYFTKTENVNFILTPSADAASSSPNTTYADTASTSWIKLLDNTYSITFNVPRIIDGRAICNITMGSDMVTATAARHMKAVINVNKGATFLASGPTELFDNGAIDATIKSSIGAAKIDIPKTSFAIGDVLNVDVEIWCLTVSPTGNARIGYSHDPSAQLDTGAIPIIEAADTTQSKILIPFVVDL